MPDPFPETRWSMILRLREPSAEQRRAAFSDLCAVYWRPLYAFARGAGQSPHDAEDCVQGFLAQLLSRDLGELGPEGGHMRTFLKVAFRRHLTDRVRRAEAGRRGGGQTRIAFDAEEVERELVSHETPDVAYDRHWTNALLARGLALLREKYEVTGKGDLYKELEPHLTDGDAPAYAQLAQKLGRSEPSLRMAVQRLREHYRALLRAEVADTLGPGEDPDAELRCLLGTV